MPFCLGLSWVVGNFGWRCCLASLSVRKRLLLVLQGGIVVQCCLELLGDLVGWHCWVLLKADS